jgi:trans-aconitate 2-methyltransferase
MVDWDGAGYEQISDLQRTMARRSLSRLVLRGDEECLDVGCGDGYVTRLVAAQLKTGSVLGVDASPRMVEAARSAPIPEGSRVSFEIGNALQLGLDRQFDLVFSFNVLHWIVDQRAVLAQLAAATRSTGHVVVQYVCGGPRPSLERVAMQVCAEPRWAGTFHGFHAPFIHVDPNSYANLVAAAGLRIQDFAVNDEEWDFGSREAFVRWCTVGFADWTARLAPVDVRAWVDDVVDRYQDVVGSPGLFRFLQLFAEMVPATVEKRP